MWLLLLAALLAGAAPSWGQLGPGCCGCACVNGIICDQLASGEAECDAICGALVFPCSEPINPGFNPDPDGCEAFLPCDQVGRAAVAPALGGVGLAISTLGLALLARRRLGGRPASHAS